MTRTLLRWVLLACGLLGLRVGYGQGIKWGAGPTNYAFNGASAGYQVVADAAGNTYLAGTGGASVAFGELLPAAQRGTGSLFILKRDPSGKPLWVLRGDASAVPQQLLLGLDGAGQPVLAGSFAGKATFGSTSLTSAGGTDGFVARLTADGSWLGAVQAGGPLADRFTGLAVQPDGTAYVTGSFLQAASFDGLPDLATTSGKRGTNLLVARLGAANTWEWAVGTGNSNASAGQGIVVDNGGRVSITGYFLDSLTLNNLPQLRARSGIRGQASGRDIFVAQLDAATGTWQWATRAGGTGFDGGSALAVDGGGQLYVGGHFSGSIDFGDSLALPVLTSRGSVDLVLARLSPSGTWQWATQAGGTGGAGISIPNAGLPSEIVEQLLTLTVDAAGTRVTVGGIIASGPKLFGPDPAPVQLPTAGGRAFVAQATGDTGTWLNAKVATNSFNLQIIWGLALAPNGDVHVAGQYVNALAYGAEQEAASYTDVPIFDGTGSSSGFSTAVLAALLQPDTGTWAQPLRIDNGGNIVVRATTHDAAGNTYITGAFDGNVVLDTPVPTRLVSTGSLDAFVGKLDPAGHWLWAVPGISAGTQIESGTGIAVDGAGRVTVTGQFRNARFGFGTLSAPGAPGASARFLTILLGLASSDTFVAQLDAATGAPRWVTSLVGASQDDNQAFALCRDPATDDLIVAGTFSGTLTTSSGGALTATATGQFDGFLARIGADGQWQWLRQAGGQGIGDGVRYNNLLFTSLQQDASGAYVVGGLVQGMAQLGSVPLAGCPLVNFYSPFVARLDATATTWQWQYADLDPSWYRDLANDGTLHAAAVDVAGNVYFPAPANRGGSGAYLLRQLSPAGALLRTITVPNAQVQPAYMLTPDPAGGVIVAGSYAAPATFGNTTLPGSGRFIARLDASGAWSWAGQLNKLPLGDLQVVDAGGTMTAVGTFKPATRPSTQPFVVARVLPPPSISSFAAASGNSGDRVVLTGRGFTDADAVAFNGVNAPGFVVSDGGTTITVTVPVGATTGPITVTSVGGVGASAMPFFILINDLIVSTPQNVQGTYNNVLVTGPATGGAGVATLTGPLTVLAGLVVQDGGTLATGCQPLTGAGSFTLASGATLSICDAAGISLSGSTGAVQLAGARSFSSDASYVYTGTAAQVTGSGLPGQVRNFTTTNPGDVALTAPLTVAQVLTVGAAGDFVLNGLALTLPSGPSGTALVVNASTGIVRGSTATMHCYLDPGSNAGRGYRHYASPVAGSTVASLTTAGFAPEVSQASAYNAAAAPGTITPFPTVFGYDQSRLATVSSNYAAFDKGFFAPAGLGAPLAVGRGYAVHIGATEVVSFTGQLTAGDLPLALGRNAAASADASEAGWHLVGNPYPAPLDFSLLDPTDRPGLDAGCYVFESTGPYAGAYRAYVNGVGSSPLIGSSQGFFVRVSDGQTAGALTFRNRQRLTTFGTQVAMHRLAANLRPLVQLDLRAPSGATDSFFAYAEAGATAGFDTQFDAHKLPNSTGLNLAGASGTGAGLAIDGRAAFAPATVLPLVVGVPAAGTYALTASTLRNLPAGLTAYLTDTATGQTINLSQQASYSFSVTASQASALLTGRFSLRFGAAGALATTSAALAAEVAVYPNPARGSFTVALPAGLGTGLAQAELLNNLGQVVYQQAVRLLASGTSFTVGTSGLATGVYSLRLQAGTTLVRRVVLE
jgi:hypothetical protein